MNTVPVHTPFLPFFNLGRPREKITSLRQASRHQLEDLLTRFIPFHRLSQEDEKENSRKRLFCLRTTFWLFLAQILEAGSPCRSALRQFQSSQRSRDLKAKGGTSAYCQARMRLPLERLCRALKDLVDYAQSRCEGHLLWLGHRVMVVDGSSVLLPDTPTNRAKFPQHPSQTEGCGFPMMKIVVLFCWATGTVAQVVMGHYFQHELTLSRQLMDSLLRGTILLGDRLFGDFATFSLLAQRGCFGVMRLNECRSKDFRKGKRLGPNERRVTWHKPINKVKSISDAQWDALPATMELRVVRFRTRMRGKMSTLYVATNLLDTAKYTAEAIVLLYSRRWDIELCLRDLKTTMKMEMFRCKSPKMVEKELIMNLIGYNAVRCLILEAALLHNAGVKRVSFKGTMDSLRKFSPLIAAEKNKKVRNHLVSQLMEIIARDISPYRPNRLEPRVLKRRPKHFQWLTKTRKKFQQILRSGRTNGIRRKKGAA